MLRYSIRKPFSAPEKLGDWFPPGAKKGQPGKVTKDSFNRKEEIDSNRKENYKKLKGPFVPFGVQEV